MKKIGEKKVKSRMCRTKERGIREEIREGRGGREGGR